MLKVNDRFYRVEGETYKIIHAASRDAGNRSMRAGNRTVWAVKDYNAACAEFDRLVEKLGEAV